MAKFPIVRTERTISGRGPGVRANIDVSTGGQELAQAWSGLGRAMFQIGAKRRQMTDIRSAITADSYITKAVQENLAFRETNANTAEWTKDLEQRLDKAHSRAATLDMSEDARTIWEARYQADVTTQKATSDLAATRREVEDTKAAVTSNLIEAIAGGDKIKIDEATKRFTQAMTGLVDPAEQDALFKGACAVGLKQRAELLSDSLYETAKAMPYADAIQFINEYPGLTKAVRDDVIARRKRQNEIETVVTDEVAKGKLEAMAYDVWTGAVSMDKFQIRLEAALGKTIDQNAYDELFSLAQREHKAYQGQALKTAIDDAGRQLIDVRTEFDLLAFLPGKTKAEQERILTDRQLQIWNHAQYRKALNDWFRANPDANADEIYIQGEKLLVLYRGRTPDELEGLLGEQEKELMTVYPKPTEKMLEAARKVTGGETPVPEQTPSLITWVPTPKTKAEYNNLPAGTVYVAPDGSRRTKR